MGPDERRAVSSRRLLRRASPAAAALAVAAGLAACIYLPEPVAGLPGGGSWVALPLRGWIAEGGIAAEGVAGCFAPDCAPRVAIGLFRAAGAEARTLSGVLREPERLVRFLEARDRADSARQRKAVRSVVTVERLREGGLSGFAGTLARGRLARRPRRGARRRDARRAARRDRDRRQRGGRAHGGARGRRQAALRVEFRRPPCYAAPTRPARERR